MSLFVKKKKYKFIVKFKLEELSSVPYINGSLYAKIRQLSGGSFSRTTSRQEVEDHCVKWDAAFEFECNMSANAANGVLNHCFIRISVRREVNGGRSSQKLGFVDLDLAEFAGAGLTCKRCLLEAYSNTHHRSDNSTVKLWIEIILQSGDPLFKRPTRGNSSFYAPLPMDIRAIDDPIRSADHQRMAEKTAAAGGAGAGGMALDAMHMSNNSLVLGYTDNMHRNTTTTTSTTATNTVMPTTLSNSSTKESLTDHSAVAAATGVMMTVDGVDHHHQHNKLASAQVNNGNNHCLSSGSSSHVGTTGKQQQQQQQQSITFKKGDNGQLQYISGLVTTTTTTGSEIGGTGLSHSRNPSQQSSSKASVGYGSLPAHSRQGSNEVSVTTTPASTTTTSSSASSSCTGVGGTGLMINASQAPLSAAAVSSSTAADAAIVTGSTTSAATNSVSCLSRSMVDATRINPDDIINEVVASNLASSPTGEEGNAEEEEVGLRIIVGKDGTATLGSRIKQIRQQLQQQQQQQQPQQQQHDNKEYM